MESRRIIIGIQSDVKITTLETVKKCEGCSTLKVGVLEKGLTGLSGLLRAHWGSKELKNTHRGLKGLTKIGQADWSSFGLTGAQWGSKEVTRAHRGLLRIVRAHYG